MSMTKPTSEQVTFLAAGSGAVQRTALDKFRDTVSVFDFMTEAQIAQVKARTADTDYANALDLSATIQAAINANPSLYFPAGTYKVANPIAITANKRIGPTYPRTNAVRITGDGIGVTRFACHGITGYTFTFPIGPNEYCDGFYVEGINFSGKLDATAANSVADSSSTWRGLLDVVGTGGQTTPFLFNVFIRDSEVGYSSATNGRALHLSNTYFVDIYNVKLVWFCFGVAVYSAPSPTVNTTMSLRKLYCTYNRQCFLIAGNTNDWHFQDCVFEASVIAGTTSAAMCLFTNCWFEGFGYDVSQTGITSSVVKRGFGVWDATPTLDVGINAVIGQAGGSSTYINCNFVFIFQAGIDAGFNWLYCLGLGSNALTRFIGCGVQTIANGSFLQFVPAAAQRFTSPAGIKFIWQQGRRLTESPGFGPYLSLADIRAMTASDVMVPIVDTPALVNNVAPYRRAYAEVNGGRITIHRADEVFPAPGGFPVPNVNPSNRISVTAGSFVNGQAYSIVTVGTTDYTLIGAASNTIGVQFVASGAGSGTGTAYEIFPWEVGDIVYFANPVAAGAVGAMCTTAGYPGTWTVFGEMVARPTTKTANFTVGNADQTIINNKSGSSCTVTLPTASLWTGRRITIINKQAQTVVSASSNVVPIDTATPGTAIIAATAGKWATLMSDGTNWNIVASN